MEVGIYVDQQISWSKARVITILTKKTTSRIQEKTYKKSFGFTVTLTICQTPYKQLKNLYLSNMLLLLNGKLQQKNAYNKTRQTHHTLVTCLACTRHMFKCKKLMTHMQQTLVVMDHGCLDESE